MYSTRLREEAVKMETCILEYIPVMAHVINTELEGYRFYG